MYDGTLSSVILRSLHFLKEASRLTKKLKSVFLLMSPIRQQDS